MRLYYSFSRESCQLHIGRQSSLNTLGVTELCKLFNFIKVQASRHGETLTVFRICQIAVCCVAVFNVDSYTGYVCDSVFDQDLLLSSAKIRHRSPPARKQSSVGSSFGS